MEKNRSLLILKDEINSIDIRTNPERIRYSLYSIYVNLLLSHELFSKNEDIKELCEQLKFPLKDYIFKSRTLLVARFMRKIEKISDSETIILFFKTAQNLINANEPSKKVNSKENKYNFIDKYGKS
ncbi:MULTISPECIES: hypothetical protein [Latilactobacillus]|uniref:Uncharacterized protein n=1 Tax=Latilactobacillus curvatus TaxID=28038 RepID=A0ABM7QWL4_LATCU|nr:hypothetical protein [Latilactobacillus curvatus]UTC12409.1 hypothetical protein A4W75_04735 [Latilactobacillus curvatus]BCX31452.1 hypothetical protein LTWDN19_20190 [Latilactobacillus curvatus]